MDTRDDDRIPVGEALPGFKIHPLPDGYTPIEGFMLIKSMDRDGDTTWAFRTSNPLDLNELLGVLVVQTELLRQDLVDLYIEDDEDD